MRKTNCDRGGLGAAAVPKKFFFEGVGDAPVADDVGRDTHEKPEPHGTGRNEGDVAEVEEREAVAQLPSSQPLISRAGR